MNTTPVVLFIFKRSETLPRIFEQIRSYSPSKLYLIADGPRNKEEEILTKKTRELALSLVDWPCNVVKDFSSENCGVYDRIGLGAKKVLQKEKNAIFLEDDNLPEKTFFKYCDELLERYEKDNDILWICGTNYFGDTTNLGDGSYYYTRNLLPCGWASWGNKFIESYDGELESLNQSTIKKLKETYLDKRLFKQELQTIKQTKINFQRNPKSVSWDRQMCFSVRAAGKYGIAPSKNQIKNIGADVHSEHGGTSTNIEMTGRFCEVETFCLNFPLISPKEKQIDTFFESRTEATILYPLKVRLKVSIGRGIKRCLGLDPNDSLTLLFKNKKIIK